MFSATEGADSRPASGPGTPSDEKAGQVGIGMCKKRRPPSPCFICWIWLQMFNKFSFSVTTKVTQGAKNFGSFLYSSLNKAGAKIKETVKDNVSCEF